MIIGLCDRMAEEWLEEFQRGCQRLGLEYRVIRIGRGDWLEQLAGLDAFIWRVIMSDASCMAEARTKIPLIESMGIPCFPSRQMLWLFDDKIRESFFFQIHGYPLAKTEIFFDGEAAREFLAKTAYPIVTKSHCGASSSGVALLRTPEEARRLVDRIFQPMTFWDKVLAKFFYIPRLERGDLLLQLQYRYRRSCPQYAYFQEFIHTDCDWRITTLGKDLVSVFVRRNRPNDFRASGGGLWEKVEEPNLPVEACDLALRISHEQGFISMTYDFMRAEDHWVIGEISYSFVLNQIYCDTLFRREQGSYHRAEPIPVGVMHLTALLDSPAMRARLERAPAATEPPRER
jgi:hypothetical protein